MVYHDGIVLPEVCPLLLSSEMLRDNNGLLVHSFWPSAQMKKETVRILQRKKETFQARIRVSCSTVTVPIPPV
jgi:hypothetical protein